MSDGFEHRTWRDVAVVAPRRAPRPVERACQCVRTQEAIEGGRVYVDVCAACALAGAIVRTEENA